MMTTVRAGSGAAELLGAGAVREAAPEEVREWLARGECVLVDVREADEHAQERIAGAVLEPLSRFDVARVAARVRPGQRVVLHCRGGKRSADACRLAASLGEQGTALFSMSGGIEAWKQRSLPVVTGAKVACISVMRQVQLTIGICTLVGCALAWLVHPGFLVVPAFLGAGLTFAGATGTCALATVLGKMPWNRLPGGGAACASGSCG